MIKLDNTKNRLITVIVITCVIAGIILAIVLASMYLDIGRECPFKRILNIDCPGCGATRMAISLIRFDFYQAFRWNPFIFSTAPIVVIAYIWQAIEFVLRYRALKYIDRFMISYTVALLIFGVIRNIKYFDYLAPTLVK